MRLKAFFLKDILFQWKQGIHFYYMIVTFLYILLLWLLPSRFRSAGCLIILFSDPTVLGFFFSGIVLYLDKEILPSLFITPLRMDEYIVSRIISFFLISFGISFVLLLLFLPGNFNALFLFLGLAASAPFFTICGMIAALYFKDSGTFLIIGGSSIALFALPFLELLPIRIYPLYLPTRSTLQLFQMSLGLNPLKGNPLIFFGIAILESAAVFAVFRYRLHQFLSGTIRKPS